MRRWWIVSAAAAFSLAAALPLSGADSEAPDPDGDALLSQGLVLEKAQDFEGAIGQFQAALQADPSLEDAQLELGRCYAELGWKPEALQHYQVYLAAGGDDPNARSYVQALEDQGRRIGTLPAISTGPWSLRAAAGYGWGFNNTTVGRSYGLTLTRTASSASSLDYATADNNNVFAFQTGVGEGPYASLEGLYAVSPGLSLGLAVLPLQTDASSNASYITTNSVTSNNITTTSSIRVQHLAVPVLLTAHTRARLGSRVWVGTAFGLGPIFSQPYVEDATQVRDNGAAKAPYTTTSHYQRDYGVGMAFQAGVDVQAQLGPHLVLSLQSGLLIGSLTARTGNYYATETNASGQVLSTTEVTDNYVSSPPVAGTPGVSSDLPDTAAVSPTAGTYALSYDNGPSQYTLTRSYGSGAGHPLISQDLQETNALSSAGSADNINYKQVSTSVGLQWEF